MIGRYILPSCLILAATISASAQQLHRWPAVGAVTHNSATVLIWLETQGTVAVEYAPDSIFTGARMSAEVASTAASDNAVKIGLTGLAPATRYFYRIRSFTGSAVSPTQSFTTFPARGVDAPATVLFGSCQQRRRTDSGRVFDAALRLGGDLFVHLGDWTYPDARLTGFPLTAGTLRQSYEDRYDTTYSFVRNILSRMGFAYAWDDHDYWKNNADGSLPGVVKSELMENYRRYIPHYPLPNNAGVWQSIRIANAEIFLLDLRSQRMPVDSAFLTGQFQPRPGHSMLAGYPIPGIDQRAWLMDAIRRSTARWKIIASPVFFNPAAAQIITLADLLGMSYVSKEMADKWVGYPEDIDSVRSLIAEGSGRNMVVISGDAHINTYDDGTRSIIPEFMAANLDITTVRLFDTLESFGIKLWSGIQTGTNNTIGRLRIETTPVHRLIMESFDEDGNIELQHIVADSSTTSVRETRGIAGGVEISVVDRNIRLHFGELFTGDVALALFDASGREVFEQTESVGGRRQLDIPLPREIAPGVYVASLRAGGDEASVSVLVWE